MPIDSIKCLVGGKVKVLVLGGDGFCGWPTSLHLAACGHSVTIADNLARRETDRELGTGSLTPIATIQERLDAWKKTGNLPLKFIHLDVARDYDSLANLLRSLQPDTIVHFAEQRAAPYSMKSARHKRHTVDNNVAATHNLLCAMVEAAPEAHLIHLGTMGVYGYGKTKGMKIPEGYIEASLRSGGMSADAEILYPADPGSIYHMTKTLDQLMFYFYAKNDRLSITDLHQGIVWGTNTPETDLHDELVNRFDYDGDYGTVLNRFLMQAAVGHPLTVYGSGRQTRAFIHIRDTVRCIELAASSRPARGERVKIINQMTETHRICDLAIMISEITGAEIQYLDNPRKEAAENELCVTNETLLDLGLNPTRLSEGLMHEVFEVAMRHSNRSDRSKIPATARW
jgi:UDP-sulfoquinovose synthase